jgi:hypothetical protein
VAVTLPAQSIPDRVPPQQEEPSPGRLRRRVSRPAALVGVISVGVLVVIVCVLGIAVSGLFSFGPAGEIAAPKALGPPFVAPTRHGAVTQFDDGLWIVTLDIRPGTYQAIVPASSPGCSWQRTASSDGTVTSVLESGTGTEKQKIIVSILPTDKVFQSAGCGMWVRTGD